MSLPEFALKFPAVRQEQIAGLTNFIPQAQSAGPHPPAIPERVLLDEELPQELRLLLGHHEAVTIAYQGWAGISNGGLVTAAENAGFEVLVTADQGLNYQQNLKGRKLALVVLSTNRNSLVVDNAPRIAAAIDVAVPGSFVYVEFGH